jgi:hypothetical protein
MLTLSVLAVSLLAAPRSEFPTFEDKGDLFVKAGKKHGLVVGTEVELLGERIGDTDERRSIGLRTVMEVWDNLARLSGAEGGAAAKSERARLAPKTEKADKKVTRAAPAKPANNHAAADPESGKTSAVMGFNDHLTADCSGHQVDVFARSTLLGGVVTLQIDGQEVTSQEVFPGQEATLAGKAGELATSVRVSQGLFGTDYALNMGGKRCKLIKL